MSARGEDAWIRAAAERFVTPPGTLLGIGHDAAALRIEGGGVVVAKDVIVDGVHFDLSDCGGAAAARKAVAVNLSDLAAAASVPVAFLVGLVLPAPASKALFDDLVEGLVDAAGAWACPCLGGDTNVAAGPLVLSVTVLGRPGPMGVLSRTGAQVGDMLSVTGPLGGSRDGRHLRVEPRCREALVLAEHGVPHAMIDVSDGLSRDLPRLCAASGVGARLVSDAIPIHADAGGVLERALHEGEDFELLVAHAPLTAETRAALAAAGVVLEPIGAVTSAAEGVVLQGPDGAAPLPRKGWDHIDA